MTPLFPIVPLESLVLPWNSSMSSELLLFGSHPFDGLLLFGPFDMRPPYVAETLVTLSFGSRNEPSRNGPVDRAPLRPARLLDVSPPCGLLSLWRRRRGSG